MARAFFPKIHAPYIGIEGLTRKDRSMADDLDTEIERRWEGVVKLAREIEDSLDYQAEEIQDYSARAFELRKKIRRLIWREDSTSFSDAFEEAERFAKLEGLDRTYLENVVSYAETLSQTLREIEELEGEREVVHFSSKNPCALQR